MEKNNTNCLNSEVQLFLLKSLIGRKSFERDGENYQPDKIIMGCIKKAYDDMMTAGRFYLTGKGMKEKRCKALSEKLFGEPINYDRKYNFSRDDLFGEAISVFKTTTDTELDDDSYYGLAQKWVNMTFKYLYVCKAYTGLDIDFSNCDCPLDSVLLEKVPKEYTGERVWSKIKENDYSNCQSVIAGIKVKNNTGDDLGNLLYDFIAW